MKVFVDSDWHICDYEKTERNDLKEFEIDDDVFYSFFSGKCRDYILGYSCKLLNTEFVDEKNLRKSFFSIYPWMNFDQLTQIQLQYEIDKTNSNVDYVTMMTGIEL